MSPTALSKVCMAVLFLCPRSHTPVQHRLAAGFRPPHLPHRTEARQHGPSSSARQPRRPRWCRRRRWCPPVRPSPRPRTARRPMAQRPAIRRLDPCAHVAAAHYQRPRDSVASAAQARCRPAIHRILVPAPRQMPPEAAVPPHTVTQGHDDGHLGHHVHHDDCHRRHHDDQAVIPSSVAQPRVHSQPLTPAQPTAPGATTSGGHPKQ
jgi:hypothetical protein